MGIIKEILEFNKNYLNLFDIVKILTIKGLQPWAEDWNQLEERCVDDVCKMCDCEVKCQKRQILKLILYQTTYHDFEFMDEDKEAVNEIAALLVEEGFLRGSVDKAGKARWTELTKAGQNLMRCLLLNDLKN